MKTRVIQDQPEQPGSNGKAPVDLASAQMQRAMNIAGRMGAWSAAHWKTAVFGWLACVVVLFGFGGQIIGLKQIDQNDAGVGQSHRADQILKKAFPERAPQTEFVLIEGKGQTVNSPAFRATVGDVIGSVKSNPAIKSLNSPYGSSNKTLISDDRHAATVKWELRVDADEDQQNVAAEPTSGRSVLISGFTVLIAMAGLFFAGDKTYLSFGIATMIVVGVAMLGSLTVLPALLSKLGPRVDKGRIPFVHRFRNDAGGSRLWKAILTPVLKHPLAAIAVAGGLLLAVALPAVHLHTTQSGFEALPKNAPTVKTIQRLQNDFSNGNVAPAIVAVEANTDSPATQQAIAALKKQALASGQVKQPIDVEISASHQVARVTIPLVGKGNDTKSNNALAVLRNEVLPATIGRVPEATYSVTGNTAQSVDQNALLKSKAPIVFGFVLIFAFGLLLVSFRSIVIAVKAILLNLLSVGAAYGVLIAIFQWGWGENLLNFQSNGGIAYWLPIFLFVILFGLSMDYHVFILSRVREAYDRGLSTEDAVEHGIASTAGVVTSAAFVMVGVFF